MTPLTLAVCLALAAVAGGVAAGAVVLHLVAAAAARPWWWRLGPRTRAGALRHARLAPLTLGLAFAAAVLGAFWRFEPENHREATGAGLVVLAAAGAMLIAAASWRAWRAVSATGALVRGWRASAAGVTRVPGWGGVAWAVRTPFPVVAVTGVRRAELFVSADVLAACTPEELAVIAAHERAHLDAHDNRSRLLFLAAPAAGRAARSVERQWAATAEEIADLKARAAGDGLTLARALTKVARLAAAPAVPTLVSALIGDDSLERRVRRLLAPPQPAGRSLRAMGLAAAIAVASAAALTLPAVYAAAEWLVRLGR